MKNYILLALVLFSPFAFGSSAVNPANTGNLGGFQGTNTTAYTPVLNGFGSATNKSGFWYRHGDRMIGQVIFTSGSTSGVTAKISLPSGYLIDATKMGSVAKTVYAGKAYQLLASQTAIESNGIGFTTFVDTSDTSNVYISRYTSSSGFEPATDSTLTGSGNTISATFNVPILGWSAGGGNASLAKICSGLIVDSGTAAISRSTENCAASVADVGTGQYTVTFTTGYFSTTPNCTCSAYDSSQTICTVDSSTAISPTTARFKVADNSTTPVNASTMFICTQ